MVELDVSVALPYDDVSIHRQSRQIELQQCYAAPPTGSATSPLRRILQCPQRALDTVHEQHQNLAPTADDDWERQLYARLHGKCTGDHVPATAQQQR